MHCIEKANVFEGNLEREVKKLENDEHAFVVHHFFFYSLQSIF